MRCEDIMQKLKNEIRKIYYNMVPYEQRTRRGIQKIKNDYKRALRRGELTEYRKECEFLINDHTDSHKMIPYKFYEEKMGEVDKIDVCRSSVGNLAYVLYENKKLFFPGDMSDDEIRRSYVILLAEQDVRSPHRYFSDINKPVKDSIFIDIGAAEGIVALHFVDKVAKVKLIESDERWKSALKATFGGYPNVEILSAFIGSPQNGGVLLSDVVAENKNLVIKMDIEGNEIAALTGMESILSEKTNKYALCTYHNHYDATKISKIFEKNDIHYEYSQGYMFMPSSEKGQFPFFRHGVIRGVKN